MTSRACWNTVGAAILLVAVPLSSVGADFELTAPDGRPILLKSNGTWRYLDSAGKDATSKPADTGEAVLTLLEKKDTSASCKYSMELVNNLSYEIRTIVPFFVAYRANGVAYKTVSANFNEILPGNRAKRS